MTRMVRRCSRLGSTVAVLAGLLTACSPSSNSMHAASTDASTPDDPQITGQERLAWTQIVHSLEDPHFAVYVDARERVELNAVCTGVTAHTLSCESPIPPLPAGFHTLELVAWFGPARSWGESAKSAGVVVHVGSP
jgi:hypothetical protein